MSRDNWDTSVMVAAHTTVGDRFGITVNGTAVSVSRYETTNSMMHVNTSMIITRARPLTSNQQIIISRASECSYFINRLGTPKPTLVLALVTSHIDTYRVFRYKNCVLCSRNISLTPFLSRRCRCQCSCSGWTHLVQRGG